jgi:antitoxin component YwqK of YwqJK toxin-antitoxin module
MSEINLEAFCVPTLEIQDDLIESDRDLDETINNTQGHKISPIESRMNVTHQAQIPSQLAREWNLEPKAPKSNLTKSKSGLSQNYDPLPMYPLTSKPEEKPLGISLLTYEGLHAD